MAHTRNAPAGQGQGASEDVEISNADSLKSNAYPPAGQLRFTEQLDSRERAVAREVWWRQKALGFRLPVERGVVVLKGGAR